MEISFDPSNADERRIIRAVLSGWDAEEGIVRTNLTAEQTNAPAIRVDGPQNTPVVTPLPALDGADTRNPAEVFAPLAVAPSTADVQPLPSVPGVLPVGAAATQNAQSLPVASVPQAAAPTAPAQTASPAGVEVDSTGLPWDARIHSSSKSRTQKGVWTRRKNLNDEAMVKRVEAELRQLMALPAGAASVVAPQQALPLPPVTLPPGSSPTHFTIPPGVAMAGGPAGSAVAPVAPPPTPTSVPTTLDQLLPLCTAAETAGVMPKGALLAACQAHQMNSPVNLAARPDFVPVIYGYLKQQYPNFA